MAKKIITEKTKEQIRRELLESILDYPPVQVGNDRNRSIDTLVSHSHIGMYITSIISLSKVTNLSSVSVVLWDDGTLTDEDVTLLNQKIQGIQINKVDYWDTEFKDILTNFPSMQRLFNEHVLTKKLFIPLTYLRSYPDRNIVLMDSDILFFRHPETMFDWFNSSGEEILYNTEIDYRPHDKKIRGGKYMPKRKINDKKTKSIGIYEPVEIHKLSKIMQSKLKMAEDFNSGFLLIKPKHLTADFLNRLIGGIYQLGYERDGYRFDLMEQVIFGLIVGTSNTHRKLPDEYFCYSIPKPKNLIMRHYIGNSKYMPDKYLSDAKSIVFK